MENVSSRAPDNKTLDKIFLAITNHETPADTREKLFEQFGIVAKTITKHPRFDGGLLVRDELKLFIGSIVVRLAAVKQQNITPENKFIFDAVTHYAELGNRCREIYESNVKATENEPTNVTPEMVTNPKAKLDEWGNSVLQALSTSGLPKDTIIELYQKFFAEGTHPDDASCIFDTSPMAYAAIDHQWDLVLFLLANKAMPDKKETKDFSFRGTALHWVAAAIKMECDEKGIAVKDHVLIPQLKKFPMNIWHDKDVFGVTPLEILGCALL